MVVHKNKTERELLVMTAQTSAHEIEEYIELYHDYDNILFTTSTYDWKSTNIEYKLPRTNHLLEDDIIKGKLNEFINFVVQDSECGRAIKLELVDD